MSRRRRKHRGQRLPALFSWTPDGDTTTEPDTADNPLTRRCPHCHASPGTPCTRPTRYGNRHQIHGYHDSRRSQPEDQP